MKKAKNSATNTCKFNPDQCPQAGFEFYFFFFNTELHKDLIKNSCNSLFHFHSSFPSKAFTGNAQGSFSYFILTTWCSRLDTEAVTGLCSFSEFYHSRVYICWIWVSFILSQQFVLMVFWRKTPKKEFSEIKTFFYIEVCEIHISSCS